MQHGLLKGSFIPDGEQRDLRELTRYRCTLVEERAHAVNRLQKTLEDTNLKLGDVATDMLGKSARAMLDALLAGETDPQVLAGLVRGRRKRETGSVGTSPGRPAQAASSLHGGLHNCVILTGWMKPSHA